jgi:hypothetical protein
MYLSPTDDLECKIVHCLLSYVHVGWYLRFRLCIITKVGVYIVLGLDIGIGSVDLITDAMGN